MSTERNEKSGNNIKDKLDDFVPEHMDSKLIEIMRKWKVVSKSPYSFSFYDITNKGWDDEHHSEFYRVSDHWNFRTNSAFDLDIHCRTDKPIINNLGFHLAKYNPKTNLYEIQKFFPYLEGQKLDKEKFKREQDKINKIQKFDTFELKVLNDLLNNKVVILPYSSALKFDKSKTLKIFVDDTYASWIKEYQKDQTRRPWIGEVPDFVREFVSTRRTQEFTRVFWLKSGNLQKLKNILHK